MSTVVSHPSPPPIPPSLPFSLRATPPLFPSEKGRPLRDNNQIYLIKFQ